MCVFARASVSVKGKETVAALIGQILSTLVLFLSTLFSLSQTSNNRVGENKALGNL